MKLRAAGRRVRLWLLFRSPAAYRRQRRRLPRGSEPCVGPTSHRNLRYAPISNALRSFRPAKNVTLSPANPLPRLSFRLAKPPARCAWPDQTGVKLPAAARTCDRLRQWPLFRSPRAYRRQRRGLPRDPGPPVSPTSHRNLRCAPISSALRHFRLFSATGLTVQQNSLDIDSIARKPAPKAKFQVRGQRSEVRGQRSEVSGVRCQVPGCQAFSLRS